MWIRVIQPEDATGELKRVYDDVAGRRGAIANVLKVHSLHPETMQTHLAFYMSLLYGKSRLSRAEREMIAVAVSRANGCDYCVRHHADALGKYLKDPALFRAIQTDYREGKLTARQRAMLDYAFALTKYPDRVTRQHVEAMRAAGMQDDEILDAALITGYFNFVNRAVNGLGVEIEAGLSPEQYKY